MADRVDLTDGLADREKEDGSAERIEATIGRSTKLQEPVGPEHDVPGTCAHSWQLVGATTATDGYRCTRCGLAIEVEADGHPACSPWCAPPPTTARWSHGAQHPWLARWPRLLRAWAWCRAARWSLRDFWRELRREPR